MSAATSRWLKLSTDVAATAGFVWLLERGLALDALGRAFAGLSLSLVLLALVFLAAGWLYLLVSGVSSDPNGGWADAPSA